MSDSDRDQKAGTAEFKTVKAGCGIRFDPETLDDEAGFDFSAAEQLKEASSAEPANAEKCPSKSPNKALPDTSHSLPDSSGT